MTGRLLYGGGHDASGRHVRARIRLDRGTLLFSDARRFGTLTVHRGAEPPRLPGVDPLSRGFTPRSLAGLLGRSRQEIKPWLLRQDRIAGIGNIYASEILHAARINPRRCAGLLAPGEIRRLHEAVVRTLRRAVTHRGTTISDYQDSRGRSGGFQRLLAVYGREGRPCRRCGQAVVRCVQQGRGTWFCRRCQPAAGAGMESATLPCATRKETPS
jgi:formamidopyrimidine-DNA glycosylase